MKIKVEVQMYPSRKSLDIEITGDDIRALAEQRAMETYTADSCQAKTLTITHEG